MIPYGRQDIIQEDIDAVVDVLQSDFLTQGPAVPRFEQALCDYTGAKYAVAVNSATSALHIACLSLGLGVNDWLWTSPITFVASANCALYCGSKIDFVDIDPITFNISIDQLKVKLVEAEKHNRLPKVLVAVHLCGLSCDMEEIYKLSRKYGFFVIEDASHAVGGSYKNHKVGNCKYSDITVFSFHPVKIITAGEGGVAMTNTYNLSQKMQLLRSHGVTRDPELMVSESDGPWYYQQIDLGFNYRMTDMQAALGVSQLQRIDEFVAKRHLLAKRYYNLLSNLPLQLPDYPEDKYSALHLFVIRLKNNKERHFHKQFFQALREKGIGVNLHYIPVHCQPYYKKMGFNEGDFPEAERYYSEAISLPMYPLLSEDDILYIVEAIREQL